ncbi:unnamed protein product [[Candida] boidinii]|uniref:Unnamed protein product n=1 Tax=Candida boidinii TaxID=5477 RepID=A0ACB5UB99_CANBO|nr:unnamed protein product [[Candida] boidinii]
MLKIKSDDKLIDYEGVDSLTVPELQIACASRGIRVHTATPDQMRRWLQYWLDLTLREKVPSTLCIMVNAYFYGDVYTSQYDALKALLKNKNNLLNLKIFKKKIMLLSLRINYPLMNQLNQQNLLKQKKKPNLVKRLNLKTVTPPPPPIL